LWSLSFSPRQTPRTGSVRFLVGECAWECSLPRKWTLLEQNLLCFCKYYELCFGWFKCNHIY
jgi:hypothetical protein